MANFIIARGTAGTCRWFMPFRLTLVICVQLHTFCARSDSKVGSPLLDYYLCCFDCGLNLIILRIRDVFK